MFEFGREFRRWFGVDGGAHGPQDGLTGGESALLELLELDLLRQEAKAADVAAGRISAKDRPQRQLEAAIVWREIARRTADPVALRKAASAAELAAAGFGRETRPRRWAAARAEQARCAMLGADLFGDPGLTAAADFALAECAKIAGGEPEHMAARASLAARTIASAGDRAAAMRAAAGFDGPIRAIETLARRGGASRSLVASARLERAELLAEAGGRLKDPVLLRMAVDGLTAAGAKLDAAYEPLSWARVATAHGRARSMLGELVGEVGEITEAVNGLVGVLEQVSRGHSPMDWARAQLALAAALQKLGDAGDAVSAFQQALMCYDRALTVLCEPSSAPLRAAAAHERVICLVRKAELTGDLESLADAEASLKVELTLANPAVDPVAWALRQLSFAEIADARDAVTGRRRARRAGIGLALAAALDVFAEHGMRSLADATARSLERMRQASPQV